MTRVKSRNVSAIGGWEFFEAALGKKYHGWDFNTVRDEIIAGRKGNPRFNLSTDTVIVGNELEERNALRMLNIPGGETYVDVVTSDVPKYRAPQPASPFLQNAVAASEKVIGGAKITLEMFGPKGPVTNDLATKRASICADCPKNDKGDWTRFFTIPASFVIRQMLEIVHDMKLTTPYDDQLVFCTACSCPLKTKVHAPLEHIKEHTPKESLADVDPRCWIINESNP